MQVIAKPDEISALTEEHEALVINALSDGVVTPSEQSNIIYSARRIRLASYRQARRITLGLRMIRGGGLDREIMQDVQDYQELTRQEKAAKQWGPIAA